MKQEAEEFFFFFIQQKKANDESMKVYSISRFSLSLAFVSFSLLPSILNSINSFETKQNVPSFYSRSVR